MRRYWIRFQQWRGHRALMKRLEKDYERTAVSVASLTTADRILRLESRIQTSLQVSLRKGNQEEVTEFRAQLALIKEILDVRSRDAD